MATNSETVKDSGETDDDATVLACPACDSTNLSPRTGSPAGQSAESDEKYLCRNCGDSFDDPIERPPRHGGGLHGTPKLLDELGSDDVRADGGRRRLRWALQDVDGIGPETARMIEEEFDGYEDLRGAVEDLPQGQSVPRLARLDGFGPDRARNVAIAIDESGVLDRRAEDEDGPSEDDRVGDACECPAKGHHDEDDEECLEEWTHSNGYLLCSRPKGHDGPHAACGIKQHPIMVWPDDDSEGETQDLVTDGGQHAPQSLGSWTVTQAEEVRLGSSVARHLDVPNGEQVLVSWDDEVLVHEDGDGYIGPPARSAAIKVGHEGRICLPKGAVRELDAEPGDRLRAAARGEDVLVELVDEEVRTDGGVPIDEDPVPEYEGHVADESHDEFRSARQRVLDGEPVDDVVEDLNYLDEEQFREALDDDLLEDGGPETERCWCWILDHEDWEESHHADVHPTVFGTLNPSGVEVSIAWWEAIVEPAAGEEGERADVDGADEGQEVSA